MKNFMLKLSGIAVLGLTIGSSCMASYQDIKVHNDDGYYEVTIQERHKKGGSYTDWETQETIKGHKSIQPNDSAKVTMNLSKHYEYRAYSKTRSCVFCTYKGDSFKNKTKWTVNPNGKHSLE